MEIIKFEKIGKSKYKVHFNNSELVLYEDIILKYNLLIDRDITLEKIDEITKENIFYEAYELTLNYIGIKMRNKKEIIKYLERKDFNNEVIKRVIDKLIDAGFLNDKKYIEAFVNDRINLSSYGPFKIKNELLLMDFNEDDIDEYINTIESSTWEEKLTKVVEKKLKLNKNKSKFMLLNKLKNDLFNLGYEKSMIEDFLSQISFDDDNVFEKEYEKALKKYSIKYEGDKLKNEVFGYLYRKGFSREQVETKIERDY